MNPWGITPLEAETLDALIEHGSTKAAAKALNVPVKTITSRVGSIRMRMNVDYEGYFKHLMLWDRYRRPHG